MITVEAIDKVEEDLINLLETFEDLLTNSPEKITPDVAERFIMFNAALDEFHAGRAAKIADALYERFKDVL